MTLQEIVSILLFLIIVGLVYIKEAHLFYRFIHDKLAKKQDTSYFFTKAAIVLHFLALAGIVCFAYGYFVEPYWIEVKTISLFTDKLKDTRIKLVQISDLHCDIKVRNEYKVVKIVNALKPDIVVFTGDTINTPAALPVFKDAMEKIEAKIAKLAVKGNFDVWHWNDLDLFSGTAFKVLEEKSLRFTKEGENFFVSGLSRDRYGRARKLLRNVPAGYYSIFLYHSPGLALDLGGLNVDLYLCGHTHGGQVALPFYGALITLSRYGKKYEAGKYIIGNTILYINRGIGMEGGLVPRVRFFARPEITVFNIEPKK